MTFQDLDLKQKFTYKDYLSWTFTEAVELIKGKVFNMSPAPNLYHQEVSGNLYGLIFNYLRKKSCKAFHAPFDVRLPLPPEKRKDEEIDTVVQPDICVICDLEKLDIRGCLGAPDWIIEILSPATSQKDLGEKFDIYEHAGVKEYWIIHPHEYTLLVFRLNEEGVYVGDPKPYTKGDTVNVEVMPGLEMNLKEVFPDYEL